MDDNAPLRSRRISIVHGVLALFAMALVVRAGQVQLFQHETWSRKAEHQQNDETALPAPRGEILDVTEKPLARSEEQVRLAIAPREVEDPRRLARLLLHLGVDRGTVRRATDRKRAWVEVKGAFSQADAAPLQTMPGVHPTPVGQRLYAISDGIHKIVGHTGVDGVAVDGLELALDSLLQGERGRVPAFLGAKGEKYESPELLTEPPRPGHSVVLTINYTLQEICDRALADATAQTKADGGDIVVIDPHTGAIRCLASRRSGARASGSTALTEPYEPGSTLKPFFAGALIEHGLATPDDVIETYNGAFTIAGRTITDVHRADRLSLADVIRFSSNVGIVRFSLRLTDRQMYETLRDFGFGTPTGIPYPSEATGTLREPRAWSAQSHASLAIGYEIAVTPLQLAAAYGALANDGQLMQPTLIAAIRDADGQPIYVHEPRVIRQVLSPATARTIRKLMEGVVDSGTATDASLTSYELAGKSGTARRTKGGRYGHGTYTSSFVGLFPAADPQYVVLVKLDNPQGAYYGGKTAAPVARAVIEAAIAAPDAALDRRSLAQQRGRMAPPPPVVAPEDVAAVGAPPVASEDSSARVDVPLIDTLPEPPLRGVASFAVSRPMHEPVRVDTLVVLPSVRGLPLRVALRELHRAGVRVVLGGTGNGETSPAAGASVKAGSIVRLARP